MCLNEKHLHNIHLPDYGSENTFRSSLEQTLSHHPTVAILAGAKVIDSAIHAESMVWYVNIYIYFFSAFRK